jgi:hypothetical protein
MAGKVKTSNMPQTTTELGAKVRAPYNVRT